MCVLVPAPVAFLEKEEGCLLGWTQEHGDLVLVRDPDLRGPERKGDTQNRLNGEEELFAVCSHHFRSVSLLQKAFYALLC